MTFKFKIQTVLSALLLLTTAIVNTTTAQTILFSEDFQGESNGDMTGVSTEGIAWTATCPNCGTGDIFAVDDQFGVHKGLRGNDTNGPADFVASGIDATGMYILQFDFDYESSGYSGSGNLECSSECSGCSGDPADALLGTCFNCWDYLLWNLSTGTFTDGNMVLGDDCAVPDSDHVVSEPGCVSPYDANGNLIPGNDPTNLTITIQMAMWASAENMVIDNLVITGYTKTQAIAAGLVASAGDDGNIDLCATTGSVDLFNEIGNNPDQNGVWSGPSTTSNGHLGSINLSSFAPGDYDYIVTTGAGCQDTATVSVTNNGTGPITSINGILDICQGTSTLIQGTSSNDFLWSDGSTASSLSLNAPGDYYLSSTNGCGTDTTFFTINDLGSGPSGQISGALGICGGGTTTLTASGGDNYEWSTSSTGTTESFGITNNGYVLISNTCGQDSIPFSIADQSVVADFTANTYSGLAPLDVTFINNSSNADSYVWDLGNGTTLTSTDATVTYNEDSTYTVALTASNIEGCSDTTFVTVIVSPIPDIEFPNVFTPNGEDGNDLFKVENAFIQEIEGTMFNRWGQELFTMKDQIFSWDGVGHNGKEVPEGTYFYIFKYTMINGEEREASGSVLLIR